MDLKPFQNMKICFLKELVTAEGFVGHKKAILI
jgi:hypothetical protein